MIRELLVLDKWTNADGTEGVEIRSTELAGPRRLDNLAPGTVDAVLAMIAAHIEFEVSRRGFRKPDA